MREIPNEAKAEVAAHLAGHWNEVSAWAFHEVSAKVSYDGTKPTLYVNAPKTCCTWFRMDWQRVAQVMYLLLTGSGSVATALIQAALDDSWDDA
jgi:hypothetical protein